MFSFICLFNIDLCDRHAASLRRDISEELQSTCTGRTCVTYKGYHSTVRLRFQCNFIW